MNPYPTAVDRPPLVVPAYFHPAVRPADWQRLVALERRVRLVVLNVATGPGEQPDEAFYPVLAGVRGAGITVAAYVDTDYGRRSLATAMAELELYQKWYGVDDVFFDRVSTWTEHADHYRLFANAARRQGATMVTFNHGAHPVEAYAEYADLLGTFEGPWRVYLDVAVPHWARASPADKFYHLVHSVPPSHLCDAVELASKRNAGGVFATNQDGDNPWDRMPGDETESPSLPSIPDMRHEPDGIPPVPGLPQPVDPYLVAEAEPFEVGGDEILDPS